MRVVPFFPARGEFLLRSEESSFPFSLERGEPLSTAELVDHTQNLKLARVYSLYFKIQLQVNTIFCGGREPAEGRRSPSAIK